MNYSIITILIVILIMIRLLYHKQISVIILNYKRPHNLTTSLPHLVKHPLISEILIFHGEPNHLTFQQHSKVKHYKDYTNNTSFGGARRFFHTNKCKNDIVLFLDDDTLPSNHLVNNLYKTTILNYYKNTFYGSIQRNCTKTGYGGNSLNYNSILTPILMVKKSVVHTYMKDPKGFPKYKKWLNQHKGNGEDLSLNKFIKDKYNQTPVYVEGKYKELDISNGYHNNSTHSSVRERFCKLYS